MKPTPRSTKTALSIHLLHRGRQDACEGVYAFFVVVALWLVVVVVFLVTVVIFLVVAMIALLALTVVEVALELELEVANLLTAAAVGTVTAEDVVDEITSLAPLTPLLPSALPSVFFM